MYSSKSFLCISPKFSDEKVLSKVDNVFFRLYDVLKKNRNNLVLFQFYSYFHDVSGHIDLMFDEKTPYISVILHLIIRNLIQRLSVEFQLCVADFRS